MLKLIAALAMAGALTGCVAAAVVGTAIDVTGTVVGAAVNTTGAVVGAVIPGKKDDKDEDN